MKIDCIVRFSGERTEKVNCSNGFHIHAPELILYLIYGFKQ